MPNQEEIVAVNAPTVEYYQDNLSWSSYPVGIVFSVYLANGMVVTSPKTFERFYVTKHSTPRPKPPEARKR